MAIELHEAVYTIRDGRGLGVAIVPVVDFAQQGEGVLHALLPLNNFGEFSSVCGKTGEFRNAQQGCDPKAVMIGGILVCQRCRNRLGHVPLPWLLKDETTERSVDCS